MQDHAPIYPKNGCKVTQCLLTMVALSRRAAFGAHRVAVPCHIWTVVKACVHTMQGDLIPWTVTQQFQDADFASLSGARVVRIATHPDMGRAGYGSRALALLRRYYQGQLADLVRFQGFREQIFINSRP